MFQNLNPLDKSTATLEILIMLLIAFLIGFIIAWLLKRNNSNATVNITANESESEEVSHEKCEDRVKALTSQLAIAHKAKGKLESEVNKLKSSIKKTDDLGSEATSSSEISEADSASASLLGFTPAASQGKDDLTEISGVGPFIEKKLNGLGIYTFAQISAFSDETIENVTEAIAFFPGRIYRDNWVNQAKELFDKKIDSDT